MEIISEQNGKRLQVRLSFENGYGISAVKFDGSYGSNYGLWELAVLDGEHITTNTPITNDVIGYCSDDDIAEIIHQVKNLKKP